MKLSIVSFILVGVLLAGTTTLSAQEDILSLYNLALQYDPTYRAAVHERDAAAATVGQGLALLLPTARVSAGVSRTNTDSEVYGDYDTKTFGASLQQPVFDLGRVASYKQSKVTASIGDLRLKKAELDLIRRLSSAYTAYIKAQKDLSIKEAEAEAVRMQRDIALKLRIHGEGTITDVHTAEARLKLIESEIIAAKNNVENKRNELSSIVGKPVSSVTPIPINARPPQPPDAESWIAIALENNPDILIAKLQKTQANLELNKRRSEYLPTVNITATATKSEKDLITYQRESDITVATVGMQLQFPIFEGGMTASRVSEAKNRLLQADKVYDSVRENVQTQIRNTHSDVVNTVSRIEALKVALDAAQTAVRSMKRGYEAGVRSITDVIDEERNYYSVQRELIHAQYDYFNYLVMLRTLAGLNGGKALSP